MFLRGTLECCIFPLTGYPPTTKEGWSKVFRSAKEWGLNHLRFHSWCPPKAAFEVADSLGFYLQVELPLWSLNVGENPAMNQFLYDEAKRILSEYGNHPSFCFLSLGNELQPDFVFWEVYWIRLNPLIPDICIQQLLLLSKEDMAIGLSRTMISLSLNGLKRMGARTRSF